MNDVDARAARWQSLGFETDYLDSVLPNMKAIAPLWWDGPPSSPNDVDSWVDNSARWGMVAFAMGSMGYPRLPPPLHDWREAGRRMVAATVYYFYGPWRDRFRWLAEDLDRESARAKLPWSNNYRRGWAVALSLGDWASADKLLQWPGPDLPGDEGTDDRTAEDNAYQIWLASRLRGESEDGSSPQRKLMERPTRRQSKENLAAAKALRQVKTLLPQTGAIADAAGRREMIERGSRRRPKMLLAAADALLGGDAEALSEALAAYLRHYKQREIRPNRVDFGVCLDATTLWHLARRRGLGDVALPKVLETLIARP